MPSTSRQPRRLDTHLSSDAFSDYLSSIRRYPRLTREEEASLSKRALEGDAAAQEKLVVHNLKLVVAVCRELRVSERLNLPGLVSAGNEGLILASRKYDATTGVPFGNYAPYWIKQRVYKHIAEQGYAVRIPPYRADVVNKIVRARRHLMQSLDRAPTPAEIASHAEVSADEVREVLNLLRPTVDLDAPVGDGEGTSRGGEIFEDEDAEGEDTHLSGIAMRRAVASALESLAPRKREILCLHFGLSGREAADLGRIAYSLKLSRERVRQLRDEALAELRSSGALNALVAN